MYTHTEKINPDVTILEKKAWLNVFKSFWAAAPKGLMTYGFTHMGNFLFLLLLCPSVRTPHPASRPKSQSLGPNPIPKAQILASRP